MYNNIYLYFIKNVIILFDINNFSLNQIVSYIKLKYLKLYYKELKSMILLLF